MRHRGTALWTGLWAALLLAGCSGLDPLDAQRLDDAEQKWQASAPGMYRAVIEMSGDRVDAGRFEIVVRDGAVVTLEHNGRPVAPERSEDYSIAGLFGILRQELALAEDPRLLGAPEGYDVYLLARFDPATGRLEHYRRSVGGTSNDIEIEMLEFQPSP